MWPAITAVWFSFRVNSPWRMNADDAANATAIMIMPMWTTMPPLARPTSPAEALTPGREHELAHRRAGREPAETERQHRGRRRGTRAAAAITTVATPAIAGHHKPLAQQFAGRLAPRQHRRDRHQEQQGEADRHGHPVEVRHADREPLAVHRLDDQREHRAEQHHERERGEQRRCWRGRRPRATTASRSAPAIAAGRPASR